MVVRNWAVSFAAFLITRGSCSEARGITIAVAGTHHSGNWANLIGSLFLAVPSATVDTPTLKWGGSDPLVTLMRWNNFLSALTDYFKTRELVLDLQQKSWVGLLFINLTVSSRQHLPKLG